MSRTAVPARGGCRLRLLVTLHHCLPPLPLHLGCWPGEAALGTVRRPGFPRAACPGQGRSVQRNQVESTSKLRGLHAPVSLSASCGLVEQRAETTFDPRCAASSTGMPVVLPVRPHPGLPLWRTCPSGLGRPRSFAKLATLPDDLFPSLRNGTDDGRLQELLQLEYGTRSVPRTRLRNWVLEGGWLRRKHLRNAYSLLAAGAHTPSSRPWPKELSETSSEDILLYRGGRTTISASRTPFRTGSEADCATEHPGHRDWVLFTLVGAVLSIARRSDLR